MTRSRFMAIVLGAILALVACSTPPITTPSVKSTVYLRDIVPGMPNSPTPTLVPAAGPFNLPPAGIDVPPNARAVTLTSATLHMTFVNQMKVPLNLKIFLSNDQTNLYADGNLLGEVDLQPEQSQPFSAPVKDPTIFKSERIYVGIKFATAGSSGKLVTVSGGDSIEITTSATVQVRLF